MQPRVAMLLALLPLAGCSAYLPFEELSEGDAGGAGACGWQLSVETRFPSDGRPYALAVADFDSDGTDDVVLAENDAFGDIDYAITEVQLARAGRNFEDWYIASKNSSPGGSMITRGIATGDVDADGIADVVQSFASYDSDDGSVDLDLGLGDGRLDWQGIWTVPRPDDVALGDFDGDGWLDAAVIALTTDQGYADEKLQLLWGDGQGSFALPIVFTPSGVLTKTLREMLSSDLNGDGRDDLVLSSWGDASVQVLLGTADRGMNQLAPVAVGTAPHGLAAADFDRDGKRDLAVVNNGDYTVSVLYGTGDGGFERETPIGVGKNLEPLLAVDLDRDDDLDLVVGGQDEIFTLENAGDGSFAEPESHGMDGVPGRFAASDFDGDGWADLAFSNLSRDSFSVFWGECVP
jgi:hypothetical protein